MLLDSASMYFRAFYGVPDTITAPDGTPVNAVRGFTDMIARLVTEHRPSRLVACLDLDWRPAFRVKALPSYKAHRVPGEPDTAPVGVPEEVPDKLSPQVPIILDVLAAVGIATGGAEGYEADDVIGTLAAGERTDPVLAVSGDRDLMQIVRDEPVPVRLLYVGRGLAKAEHLGPAEVAEKYGVPRDRAGEAYAEMAMLRGDPSDGLPGAKGVGEKKAAALLREHGDLETLLEKAIRVTQPKLREALISQREELLDFKQIATLRDAGVERPPDRETDWAGGAGAARARGMNRLAERLEAAGE